RGLGIDDLIHWNAATSSIISGIEAVFSKAASPPGPSTLAGTPLLLGRGSDQGSGRLGGGEGRGDSSVSPRPHSGSLPMDSDQMLAPDEASQPSQYGTH